LLVVVAELALSQRAALLTCSCRLSAADAAAAAAAAAAAS